MSGLMRSDRQTPHLTIVVPCYNEQQVLPETVRQLTALLTALIDEKRVAAESDICFVDDGSVDATWALLCKAQYEHAHVGALKLSRNQGHQNALMAGLMNARGAVIISLDADLQDDLAAISRMLDHYVAGAEIVYGVRNLRATDTAGKRITARLYYRLLQWMNVEIVFDHADYRLMSRVVIEALRNYGESNLFLRALIPQLGFQSAIVTYDRLERFAGVSKYPLVKMLALAMDGITSFSNRPLRFISFLGAITSFGAILMSLWALYVRLFTDAVVPGWASIVVPIYLICGIQLLCMGITGEYIGKIYIETKRRPRFHIAQRLEPRDWRNEPTPPERSAIR